MFRFCAGLGLFVGTVVAICFSPFDRPNDVFADAKQEQALRNEVNQLQTQLKQAAAQLNQAAVQVNQLQKAVNDRDQAINKMKADQKKDPPMTVAKDSEAPKKTAFVHSVIFRLKKDVPANEAKTFVDDANASLAKISSVRGLWCGQRVEGASSEFADKTFTLGLVVLFDDAKGLKTYLDDPKHKQFADKHLKNWEAPVVYDYQKPNK